MVFRGRLSKACQRCRERRLRCDFKRPSCSSCLRVSTPCVGYRDTVAIRIADETDEVRTKAIARTVVAQSQQITYLAPDVETSGRDMFFAHYICDFSHTWDVLLKYRNSPTAPEHLNLALDAVGLVYIGHNTGSTTAWDLGRKKYCSALRHINTELQNPDSAKRASTFEGAMLLDLFDKMTKSVTEGTTPRHAHVEGALALSKLRGIEAFQTGAELRSLLGLSLNATICSLTTGQKTPDQVNVIRRHASKYMATTDLNWKLSEVIIEVTDLAAEIHTGALTLEEKAARCLKLDNRLVTIVQNLPGNWTYKRAVIALEHQEGALPPDSTPLYEIHPNRAAMQAWQVLRLLRILLYEELASSYPIAPTSVHLPQPQTFITPIIQDICAAVPHMSACSSAAAGKLPPGSPCQHLHLTFAGPRHTISHVLDAYILIFPLYVAAWSRYCSSETRTWILNQLQYMGGHFGLLEANIIRDILLREVDQTDWQTRKKQLNYVLLRHTSDFFGLSL